MCSVSFCTGTGHCHSHNLCSTMGQEEVGGRIKRFCGEGLFPACRHGQKVRDVPDRIVAQTIMHSSTRVKDSVLQASKGSALVFLFPQWQLSAGTFPALSKNIYK